MFRLYKNNICILSAPYYEDLISFVEIIKKYNKNFIDRKEFEVRNDEITIYKWRKK